VTLCCCNTYISHKSVEIMVGACKAAHFTHHTTCRMHAWVPPTPWHKNHHSTLRAQAVSRDLVVRACSVFGVLKNFPMHNILVFKPHHPLLGILVLVAPRHTPDECTAALKRQEVLECVSGPQTSTAGWISGLCSSKIWPDNAPV
jgi:hypothetical protein